MLACVLVWRPEKTSKDETDLFYGKQYVKYCKDCKPNKIDLLNRNKTHKWVVLWVNEATVSFLSIL